MTVGKEAKPVQVPPERGQVPRASVRFRPMAPYAFAPHESVLGSCLRPRVLTLCPELKLWLLGDDVDLSQRVSELFNIDVAPYWAFCWGSGQALARYVLDHPELVRGKVVADFGAGCGVAALAALQAGARRAIAIDIDAHALNACQENAKLNGLALETAQSLPAAYDVLLASDVLYELGNRDLLEACIAANRTVLISDPLRHHMPRLEHKVRAHYEVRTVPDVDYPICAAVIYHLEKGEAQ